MSTPVTPRALTPASGLPIQPPPLPPPRERLRGEHAAPIGYVVFTAACPNCGEDVQWAEEREDTRLHIVIACCRHKTAA